MAIRFNPKCWLQQLEWFILWIKPHFEDAVVGQEALEAKSIKIGLMFTFINLIPHTQQFI